MLSLLMCRVRRVARAAFDRVEGARSPGAALAAAGLLVVSLTAGLTGCDRAPDRLLLPGTGERDTPAIASIAGTVAVPGVSGTLPAIKVWAFRDVDSTYVSAYTAIQVVGNYTDPVFSVGSTPVMQQLVGGVWVDSITVTPSTLLPTAGQMEWKFVTNRNFDAPPDYGVLGGQVDGLVGSVVSGANGPDGNIVAKVTNAGPYYASIDEKKLRYAIVPWDEGPVAAIDRATGAFTIDLLKDGNYIVVFTGPGLVTRRVVNVRIIGGAGVNIGNVNMRSATTAITGQVEFAGNPDPRPEATVQLLPVAGETPLAELTSATGAFAFSGLDNGSYRIRLKAQGFTDSTVAVTYAGTLVNLGTITLLAGCSSAFNTIQVAGNLNTVLYGNFDLTKSPQMTQVEPCTWTATLNGVTAGDHFFKFVTNGAFDTPQDYGGNEVCAPDLSGTVKLVSGTGTAICVTFAEAGNYKFTLDEGALTFTIEQVVVQSPGTLTGTVTFPGTPPAGLKAFVQVLEAANGSPVASDSTTSRYTFTTIPAGNYKVRFSAVGYLPDTLLASVTAGQTTDLGPHALRAGFSSPFTRISVIGDFPTIGWDTAKQVDMTQITPGVWRVIVTGITGGCHFFKFRTNDNWENPDPDFGGTDPLEPCVTNLTGSVASTSTVNAALQIEFPPGDADYEFTLDEQRLTYAIVRQGQAGSGAINGVATFSGIGAAPYPMARVDLQRQGETTVIGTTTTNAATGAFGFTQLEAGTYLLTASANCFTSTTVENIVVATAAVNAGTINLAPGASRFTAMQVVGTFNGFDAGTPGMTQTATCTWADSIDITDVAAPTEFKFRSNNNWDEDPDYGSPGDQVDPLAGPCVLGAGGSAGNIKVQFAEPGRYRFELNETLSSYTITRLGPLFGVLRPRAGSPGTDGRGAPR